MADNSRYDIVAISEADWGIQYFGGPLISGFKTRDDAIASALDTSHTQQSLTEGAIQPRNLDEALVHAEALRDEYRKFIGENPSASEEAKEQKIAEMAAADATLAEFRNQQDEARKAANDKKAYDQQDYEKQVENADLRRKDLSKTAAELKKQGASPQDIAKAESDAFEAEVYFEALKRRKEKVNSDEYAQSQGIFSDIVGGVKSFLSYGGQVLNTASNIAVSSVNSNDLIRDTVNRDLGSIRTTNGQVTDLTSGTGATQYQGSTVYDTTSGVTVNSPGSEMRVRLSPKPSVRDKMLTGILDPLKAGGGLIYPYTPDIQVSGQAGYNALETVHANSEYQIYRNTQSVSLNIMGTFTSQNEEEAKYTLACIHFLRVLTKMHFGEGDAKELGLPPPQVVLDGYGTHMFNGLSVIVTGFDYQLTDDVDYVTVQVGNGISKVPTYMTISTSVLVQQTPAKARTFNWDSFASGELMQKKGWI